MHISALAFTYWMEAAREDLATLSAYRAASVRAGILARAEACVRLALRAANAMNCPTRKALCFQALNWLRAAQAHCRPLDLAA